MRRYRKLIIWFGVILGLIAGAYFYVLPLLINRVFNKEPREPKLEIPVTYEIGWWSYQESINIDSFKVEFVEHNLNLFNSKSLIKYRVAGTIQNEGHWKPNIKNIHISQRFLNRYNESFPNNLKYDTAGSPEALIEITPVIEVRKDENYNGEHIKFKFENEIKLESFHWGGNSVRFLCKDKYEDLILTQYK
ncbi:MAG: hypothetical protein ACK4ND_12895 [Cytophagaceae bacterium]